MCIPFFFPLALSFCDVHNTPPFRAAEVKSKDKRVEMFEDLFEEGEQAIAAFKV